jgi:hypothetical protein
VGLRRMRCDLTSNHRRLAQPAGSGTHDQPLLQIRREVAECECTLIADRVCRARQAKGYSG